MIQRAFITEWRSRAPWPLDSQVEQDLILSRALVDIYSEEIIRNQAALRGGTALHKLFLARAERYSEDIDLVQVEAGPIGAVMDAVRQRLDPWLGKSQWKQGHGRVSRAEFEANLRNKLADPDFGRDIEPLLATGVLWNQEAAAEYVLHEIAPLLPGEH